MKKNIHVTKTVAGWQAKKEGASRASAVTKTQAEAQQAATRIAKCEGKPSAFAPDACDPPAPPASDT